MVQLETFEDSLEYAGWGIYSKFVVIALAFCSLVQASGAQSLNFGIPLSTCDITITTTDIFVTQVFICLGKAFGGYMLNAGSDIFGRKCLIPNSLIVLFSSTFAAAFCHGIAVIYIAAFCLGSGLEALNVALKAHLAEILPIHKRGYCLILLNMFWSLGYITTAAIGYGFARTGPVSHRGIDLRISGWRMILSIAGGLSILAACTTALVEGSPRYFLFKRRNDFAAAVLKQLYTINRSKSGEAFEIKPLDLESLINGYDLNTVPIPRGCTEQVFYFFNKAFKIIKLLLRKRYIRAIIAMMLIRVSMLLGIQGMNIWLAKLLYWNSGSCTVKGVDLIHLQEVKKDNCNLSPNNALFVNYFLIAANILSGQLIVLTIIERVGRRISAFLGLVICGGMCFALAFGPQIYILRLILSSAMMAAFSAADCALSIAGVEAFPTCLRGSANAQINFLAYLLSCLFYKYLYLPCQYFLIIKGSIIFGASLLSYFIPELKGRPMVE